MKVEITIILISTCGKGTIKIKHYISPCGLREDSVVDLFDSLSDFA